MGRGSYSAADWNRLKNSKGISASSTADDIFSGNSVNEKYLPQFINVRESRDSEDSPESTPIIIGFDSTGSMGYLAAEIAKNSLNRTATMILEKRPVTDPHIMCAAFTQPSSSTMYPAMQVTQFEADIRVVEQLLEFKLSGGNPYSYETDAPYWGVHVGVGKVIQLNESSELDVYGKFFHNHRNSVSFDAGGHYDLDAVNSDVLRLGTRYVMKREKWNFYGGLAYEQEFSGKAEGTADGMAIRGADTSGGSLRAELGAVLNPKKDGPITLDFNLSGFAGKKRGLTGGVAVTFNF